MSEAYIIDAVRTPRAQRKGVFANVHPVDLLTHPMNATLERNNIKPEVVEDVAMGCVTQVSEQAWCIARNAILAADWPVTVPGVTINRLCGSGLQACNYQADSIKAGNIQLGIAGGVEHMTRVPMFSDAGGEKSPLIQKHHPDLVDQGPAAELLAEHFKITREEMDEYAARSQKLAHQAQSEGRFTKSIIPVAELDHDDNLRPETTPEVLAGLRTVFKDNGTITAGNASAIVDGAASVLLASESAAKKFNLTPRARVVASAIVGSDPLIQLSGPIEASRQVLKKANLSIQDIDLWEINEAFAPVVLASIKELDLNPDLVNQNGGAIALGHPLGATGAILLGTALDELERQNKRYGLIAMCIGLGMGIATIIENLSFV